MPWNPEIYNQFKDIRYQPFYDLMEMISPEGLNNAVDIGCGTGEQTSILAKKFVHANFLGIDSSAEMLAEASKLVAERVHFKLSSIEAFASTENQWDLIFSNAALQWTDNHQELFPSLISKIKPGGQFAVQMPVQNENLLNKTLFDLVQEIPFSEYLHNWKRISPVLSMDEYAQIMFEGGLQHIQIVQKVYPIIAENPDKLYSFISGSSLIPYFERMSEEEKVIFIAEFKERIGKAFKRFPAMYAFKRMLLFGKKANA